MKLLLKIMYDGGNFCGYQYQPGVDTVQGTLTECISNALGIKCDVTGCSRTDSGVHALGYCACVEPSDPSQRGDGWLRVPVERVHRAVGQFLPSSVSVTGAASVPDDFHPRYDVISKEYIYVIYDSISCDPFLSGRAYHICRGISDNELSRMRESAGYLIGRHDFSAFMASGSSVTDTVRNLTKLDVSRSGKFITITAAADGFLYNMVRILTGTLLESAYGKMTPLDVRAALDSGDRSKAGFTAPPDGLYLHRVDYGFDPGFAAV